MEASVEVITASQLLQRLNAHPGHDPHVEHHVNGIGDLDPNFGQ